MKKLRKIRTTRPDTIEAYICRCNCTTSCSCNCSGCACPFNNFPVQNNTSNVRRNNVHNNDANSVNGAVHGIVTSAMWSQG